MLDLSDERATPRQRFFRCEGTALRVPIRASATCANGQLCDIETSK